MKNLDECIDQGAIQDAQIFADYYFCKDSVKGIVNLHPAINRLENGIKMKGEIQRGSVQAVNSKVLPFTV